jgi:hypothetical protein
MQAYSCLTGLKKDPERKRLHVGINLSKKQQANQQARHRVAVSPNPIEIPLRAIFRHENHDAGAAIERWDWKEIKSSQQQVERKNHRQCHGQKVWGAGRWIEKNGVEASRRANSQRGQQHQRVVCRRTRESHPCGAPRVAPLPQRVVGRASPADHSARKKEARDGKHDHAEERPPYVRDGIQGNLPAKCGGAVAAYFRDERVRRFVAGGRKQKDDVRNKSQYQSLWRKFIHSQAG